MVRLLKPLLTRWCYVVKCATAILQRWNDWKKFLDVCYLAFSTKEGDMSRKCLAVMKDPKLKCEIEFVVAFGRCFFTKHFEWLQHIDTHTKKAGFFSHEMLPRVAIMQYELENLQNNWRTIQEFHECVCILDVLPDDVKENGKLQTAGKQKTQEQFTLFFKLYIDNWTQQFRRWKHKLAPLCIASSNKTAVSTFALWYKQKGRLDPNGDEQNVFTNCSVHKNCHLALGQWVNFLNTCTFIEDPILCQHADTVNEIENDDQHSYVVPQSHKMSSFLVDVKKYIFVVPTVTQIVEGTVQDSALCSLSGKGTDTTAGLIIFRSFQLQPLLNKLCQMMPSKVKHANQHMGKGVDGQRELKSARSQQLALDREQSGKPIQQQIHATKDKSKAHIKHTIKTCPKEDDFKAVKRVQKRSAENDAVIPKSKKKLRSIRLLTAMKGSIANTRKNSSTIEMHTMHVPDNFKFDGAIEVTKF